MPVFRHTQGVEMDDLIKCLKNAGRGELKRLAQTERVSYSTIRSIRDGTTKHPRIDTFKKLSAHYEQPR